jgi:hypothetical protein
LLRRVASAALGAADDHVRVLDLVERFGAFGVPTLQ